MKKSPCHNCQKREVTKERNCHSDCPDYAEYVEERLRYRAYNNGNDHDYMNYRRNTILKRMKKKNEKHRS